MANEKDKEALMGLFSTKSTQPRGPNEKAGPPAGGGYDGSGDRPTYH